MGKMRMGRFGFLIAGAALLAAAGCTSKQSADKAAVEVKGSEPAARTAAPRQIVDSYGIISYETYQAAVARDGDTVSSVAARIGLSGSELGAYNGLSPTYPLRKGDELVLPPRPGGYGERATQTATAPQSGYPQSGYPQDSAATGGQALPPFGSTPSSGSTIEQAPLDGAAPVSEQPAPAQSTWSPDLAAAAIDRAGTFDTQGNLAAPPSATDPVPPPPQEPDPLTSPNLRQYQTPAPGAQPEPAPRPVETLTTQEAPPEPEETVPQVAVATPAPAPQPTPQPAPQPSAPAPSAAAPGSLRLIRPVQGPIVIAFQQGAGRARNEGVDFAAPAGSPVVAAAAGEVALVSQSLGGLGTIVLIRHQGDYLTVYGRIDKVTVVKGDLVSQGQKIGVVSFGTEPRMHFEVRQGADSYDPERFFRG